MGASRGIGAATARALAAEGMAVALAGRDVVLPEDVARDCREAGARTAVFPGDVTDNVYLAGLADAVRERMGTLHALFNNAGVLETARFDAADLSRWEHTLDINFRALVHLTLVMLPLLLEHPESAVINLISIAGRSSFSGGGIYCATKPAVHAFSGCLFEDLRDKGLKVCAIYPGYIATEMTSAVPGDREKMIQAEDIARTVSFLFRFPANACPTEVVIRPQFPLP
ncbi:SDR family oxidoreductase [Tropicimonas sp. IMCC6043]|uniref:SDR family oxidoreductase n=1 Tax=Tropicimonas sp. IMCC6043 TaxID=2510645 RepID=UPI00101C8DDB|nr:SDR family NAD(P)-dependent oxidoreductase [Tropicimonas sp. IMCC6043]RYH07004.1 SDR family NAD(P)-dependent oxidoreductase [Tropicimonas sp. IMCC6043]